MSAFCLVDILSFDPFSASCAFCIIWSMNSDWISEWLFECLAFFSSSALRLTVSVVSRRSSVISQRFSVFVSSSCFDLVNRVATSPVPIISLSFAWRPRFRAANLCFLWKLKTLERRAAFVWQMSVVKICSKLVDVGCIFSYWFSKSYSKFFCLKNTECGVKFLKIKFWRDR